MRPFDPRPGRTRAEPEASASGLRVRPTPTRQSASHWPRSCKAEFGIVLPDLLRRRRPGRQPLLRGRDRGHRRDWPGLRGRGARGRARASSRSASSSCIATWEESLWPEAKPSRHPDRRMAASGPGSSASPSKYVEDEPLDARLKPDQPSLSRRCRQHPGPRHSGRGRRPDLRSSRGEPPARASRQTIDEPDRGDDRAGPAGTLRLGEDGHDKWSSVGWTRVGLGACLELHSQKTNKKAVLDELRRTLGLGKPRVSPIDDDLRLLGETRDRLNAYCEGRRTRRSARAGSAPFQAFGERTIQVKEPETSRPIDLPTVRAWSSYDLRRPARASRATGAALAAVGVPSAHPYWGSRRRVLLPTEGDRLRGLLLAGRRETDAVREAIARLARALRLPPPAGRGGCERLLRAARRVEKGHSRAGPMPAPTGSSAGATCTSYSGPGRNSSGSGKKHERTLNPRRLGAATPARDPRTLWDDNGGGSSPAPTGGATT